MKSNPLTPIISAGLFLLPALTLQASVDSVLKLDLKCYYQEKISTSDTKEKGDVEVVRLDSKQLLKLLSKQAGVKFPGGSKLMVAVDGKVFVADSKGRTVGDVSTYFKAKLDGDNSLFDGKYNRENGEEDSTNYFPISFTINLPALKGTVTGLAIEDFKVGKADKFGIQQLNGKTTSAVNGKGQVEGKLAYYDGRMNLNGKQAIIVK
ncbi:MAG: hypothetical protein V4584_10750 [Verrucomicrobiota bacterium]